MLENILYNLDSIKRGYELAIKDGYQFSFISSADGMLFKEFIENIIINGTDTFLNGFIYELNICYNY